MLIKNDNTLSKWLHEISKTKEDLYANDHLFFTESSHKKYEIPQIPKNSSTPKEPQIINFPIDPFLLKNGFLQPNNVSYNIDRNGHHSLIEKQINNTQVQAFWKLNPQIQTIRGKTPEKNVIMKNIGANAFQKKMPYITENKPPMVDKVRHGRQFSVHTPPCFTRTSYSPNAYHLNTPNVVNNIKLVKY